MDKKFLISWAVVFVIWMAGSFFIHAVILQSSYATMPNLFRTAEETEAYSHWMLLAHIMMAGAFVWIYRRGREDKPWLGQGARFGAAIAVLTVIPIAMIYYVVQPLPGMHVVQTIVYETALAVVLGMAAAFLNRESG